MLAYRFHLTGPLGLQVSRLADPFAEIGVQLFFVISGYIITTLLVREEDRSKRVSIRAFYVRRSFRILPPLAAYFLALFLLRWAGAISFDPSTIRNSALFTCNTGLTSCEWWVAHTWSLAVEEQFYLAWPLLLVLVGQRWRAPFLLGLLAVLVLGFLALPFQWHSNWISFACIAAGALYSLSARLRDFITRRANYSSWLVAGLLFCGGPLLLIKPLLVFTPFLILFILFAARELPLISRILISMPLQAIGLCSYSLYLWQQVFLGQSNLYVEMLPLAVLPLVVAMSYSFVERPCARVGHRLSAWVQGRQLDSARRPIPQQPAEDAAAR